MLFRRFFRSFCTKVPPLFKPSSPLSFTEGRSTIFVLQDLNKVKRMAKNLLLLHLILGAYGFSVVSNYKNNSKLKTALGGICILLPLQFLLKGSNVTSLFVLKVCIKIIEKFVIFGLGFVPINK